MTYGGIIPTSPIFANLTGGNRPKEHPLQGAQAASADILNMGAGVSSA